MESAKLRASSGKALDDLLRSDAATPVQDTLNDPTRFLVLALQEGDTDQFAGILMTLVPDVMEKFGQSSRDYGNSGANVLGAAGQYADLNRKMLKLRRALWEGESLEGEQTEEVLGDLIAHCLLALMFLKTGNLRGDKL